MDKETRDMERYLQRTPKKDYSKFTKNFSPIKINENPILPEENDENVENYSYSHKVYKEISFINGQINRMNLNDLKINCKELELDCQGGKDPIKRRLKEHYKVKKLVEAGLLEATMNRNVDYFLVIDFEATCEEKNPAGYPHEIIEFPAVLISTEPPEIVDIFHSFVRPVINPKLSEFCKALTGIEQETVDSADTFPLVLEDFREWMESKHGLGQQKTYLLITDGPFDMGRFMYLQCQQSKIEFPDYLSFWANLRKVFVNFYKASFYERPNNRYKYRQNESNRQLPGLHTMLTKLGMEFEGKPHCGLDDAKNIAGIVIRLL